MILKQNNLAEGVVDDNTQLCHECVIKIDFIMSQTAQKLPLNDQMIEVGMQTYKAISG